jgi:HK97 family phage portal protein
VIETLASGVLRGGFDMLERRDLGTLADAKIGSAIYNLLSSGASTYTGRPVSPSTAMTYIPIYGCVAKISKSVASCPLVTNRNTGRNSDTSHPAIDDYRYRLLKEQPNEEMSAFQWREQVVTQMLLWGNSYSFLEWDGAGRLRNIWPLESAYVQVLRTQIGGHLVYRYFPHNPYAVPVAPGVYLAQDILHIPWLGFDGTVGFSPVTLARQAISLGMAAEEYLGRFYANGGKPPYWINFDGQINDPAKFREKYAEVTASLNNAGRPALMYGGMSLHEMKMSPEDAQYVEGSNLTIAQACRLFDMPLSMMGDPGGKASTYASSEQEDIKYAKHTIAPICERVEQKINLTVLGSNDALTCRHDMRALYRGDMLTIAKTHQAEISAGKLSPNEARAESDMNPGPPELDRYFMQGAMATVDHIVKNGSGGAKATPTTEE